MLARPQNVTLYNIDADGGPDLLTKLRAAVPGVHIICYISVGTWEPFRKVPCTGNLGSQRLDTLRQFRGFLVDV